MVPTTQPSLLVRIRDAADGEAWRQFVQLYAPVVYAYARRRQLQDADAADVTQEVLRTVMRTIGYYDPGRGSFRRWLFTMTRNKMVDFRRKRPLGEAAGGTTAQKLLDHHPAAEDESLWEEEFRRRVFEVAAEQVRREFEDGSWQAFWQTAVEGKRPQDVAASLGLSVGAVYIAKSRVQARLRECVHELTEDSRH